MNVWQMIDFDGFFSIRWSLGILKGAGSFLCPKIDGLLDERMKSKKTSLFLLIYTMIIAGWASYCSGQDEKMEPLRALIVDGQNNHSVWPTTTRMMKSYLEQSGLFAVDVATTAAKGIDPDFHPEFKNYDVIVSNYNGASWPEATQTAFVDYIKEGGGLVVIHAADNAFPNWPEYNEMIGLGGWGGRNEKSGPLVYFDGTGEQVRDESAGRGGSHGQQHPFSIVARNDEHPIMKGLPTEWMHSQDELYDRLRGPASNMTVLATSFSQAEFGGTGRHEPILMTIDYGKGRVFHSTLGHAQYSLECVGFITTFVRASEWAASGKVSFPLPADFPTPDKVSKRAYVDQVAADELGTTKNVSRVGDLYLAGQPKMADIEVAKAAGIKHVISLRMPGEIDWDEKAAVESAEMKFHTIEFRHPDELTDEVFDELRELLKMTSGEKVLLHCGSANRVGAVWATYRAIDQDVDTVKAIEEAKQVGLNNEDYERRVSEYITGHKK